MEKQSKCKKKKKEFSYDIFYRKKSNNEINFSHNYVTPIKNQNKKSLKNEDFHIVPHIRKVKKLSFFVVAKIRSKIQMKKTVILQKMRLLPSTT